MVTLLILVACDEGGMGPDPNDSDRFLRNMPVTATLSATADAFSVFSSNTSGSDLLVVGVTGDYEMRILLRPDFEALPELKGEEILEARLGLFLENENAAVKDFTLHRVTTDWAETAATWDSAATGTSWTRSGGDYDTEEDSFADNVDIDNETGIVTAEITEEGLDLIEDWIADPASNDGFIIVHDERSDGVTRYLDQEGFPALAVMYGDVISGAGDATATMEAVFITGGPAATGTGSDTAVQVGSMYGHVSVGFFYFDVSALPPEVLIQEAHVELLVKSVTSVDPVSVGLYDLAADWDRDNPDPNAAVVELRSTVDVADTGVYRFDVTDIVRDWHQDPSINHGVVLKPIGSVEAVASLKKFYSIESGGGTAPMLEVIYTLEEPAFWYEE